jgi:hypothetical protein
VGILRALFGPAKPLARPYVDEGLALTKTLIEECDLSDWASGTPELTQDEARALDRGLNSFQALADAEARKAGNAKMMFHPEAIEPMQRTLGADALRSLAGEGWTMGFGWDLEGPCPEDWQARVSTYLKAWAMNLDPDALVEMAQLLALAGYNSEAREAARIVADRFASYAPRFFAGSNNPRLVNGITERAREVMSEISEPRLLVHGLNREDSVLAIWKLLFSPTLQGHLGAERSLEWTRSLVAKVAVGDRIAFSAQYKDLVPEVKGALSSCPKPSLANPPWSMVSLDMRIGLIPWVTPAFDEGFMILLKNGSALEEHFGVVLPFAYFLSGGPGNSRETAFRVCAPTSAVRASAEHWLMRGYLARREQGRHSTIEDEAGKRFNVHWYIDQDGSEKQMFFETTLSFGREEEDFAEFLKEGL